VRQLGERGAPVRAVFAEQIDAGEVERLKGLALKTLVVTLRSPTLPAQELGFGRARRRERLEVVHAIRDRRRSGRRANAVDAVGPEKRTVGIDQPPAALEFLHAEESRGLQGRAVQPASVGVPALRPRMFLQVLLLCLAVPPQIVQRLDLSRPLPMTVLPEAVDHGEHPAGQLHCRQHFVPRRVAAHADEDQRRGELRLAVALDGHVQYVRAHAPGQGIERQLGRRPPVLRRELALADGRPALEQRDSFSQPLFRPRQLDDHRLIGLVVQLGAADLQRILAACGGDSGQGGGHGQSKMSVPHRVPLPST